MYKRRRTFLPRTHVHVHAHTYGMRHVETRREETREMPTKSGDDDLQRTLQTRTTTTSCHVTPRLYYTHALAAHQEAPGNFLLTININNIKEGKTPLFAP